MDSDSTHHPTGTTDPDFDAADLADALLADPEPEPPAAAPTWTEAQRALFWLMIISMVLLLVGLAASAGNRTSSPPEPPCWGGGVTCCVEDYGWQECCPVEPNRWRHDDGLFDAEERFADDVPIGRRNC